MTHADQIVGWLRDLGYTHCFFVSGGNSMHLLNAARQKMVCVPVVHEVSAGIAAEYFNESNLSKGKAFVLVTAGPGLTNLVTALAGAYLESRELLVLGGQVKSSDLANRGLRQRGIQEVDGVAIAKAVAKSVKRIERPIAKSDFLSLVNSGSTGRKGPVFLEVCLDAQGAPAQIEEGNTVIESKADFFSGEVDEKSVDVILDLLAKSERPVFLIGGGISRNQFKSLIPEVDRLGVPVMTTWNAADRLGSNHRLYFGRPNTWGQRSSNLILQNADLVIAVGTRLGLQQTGFNWAEFVPNGDVVQVDIDRTELEKGHPKISLAICAEGNDLLQQLLKRESSRPSWSKWVNFAKKIRDQIPLSEEVNGHFPGFLNPYDFALQLSDLCESGDTVVPCSSGGGFTVMMQAFNQKQGQVIITNKGLASMGYGLAGAIGAGLADQSRRTVLVEGDGGFSQNLQELATVDVQKLNLKIFIFANNGYASIRMTQKNYFDGAYLGCDVESGLGFPDWQVLAKAFGIRSLTLGEDFATNENFLSEWNSAEACLFVVPIHPEQTYFPKISSQVTASGGMQSAPLHKVSPPLADEVIVGLGLELDKK
ncbi:MAG: thiamine pyrophosphate-binding protein [Acidimicrobiaceae bacterium]